MCAVDESFKNDDKLTILFEQMVYLLLFLGMSSEPCKSALFKKSAYAESKNIAYEGSADRDYDHFRVGKDDMLARKPSCKHQTYFAL